MNTRFLLPLILSPALMAGELTVESQPFQVEQRFQATVLPAAPSVYEIDPESWTSFVVETLIDHGTAVKKGDLVVRFEREAYHRRIEDLERAVKSKEIARARQQFALEQLEAEQALALKTSRRAKETADEDLKYFKEIGRPAAEAEVEDSLVGARFSLEAETEELKQLKQMYEEDDLTEDTEEIILKRQQLSVDRAKFQLSEAERRAKQALETSLPRRLESLERAAASAGIALARTQSEQPRARTEAELALLTAKVELEREELELKRLQDDGQFFEWTAPQDGVVFHGGLDGDTWSFGDLAKSLKVGGTVPLRVSLVSLVPAAGDVRLSAKVDAKILPALRATESLSVLLPGSKGGEPVATIAELDAIPGTDGKHAIQLDATWPDELRPEVGSKVECIRVAHSQPDALAVPVKAVHPTPDGGWAVELKLADGKTETRRVKRGPSDGKQVVILEGLESGQVIVVPE